MRDPDKIKQKFGKDAFRTWGSEGGNPILVAISKGARVTIHREKVSRSAPKEIIRRKSKHRATQL